MQGVGRANNHGCSWASILCVNQSSICLPVSCEDGPLCLFCICALWVGLDSPLPRIPISISRPTVRGFHSRRPPGSIETASNVVSSASTTSRIPCTKQEHPRLHRFPNLLPPPPRRPFELADSRFVSVDSLQEYSSYFSGTSEYQTLSRLFKGQTWSVRVNELADQDTSGPVWRNYRP